MRHPAIAILAALVFAFGGSIMSVHAQSPAPAAVSSDGTLLSVSARAEASRAPDVATLSIGVVTQAADSAAAMRQNAEQMNRVMAAIRSLRIADKDVQTSGVSLSPQYRYTQGEAPAITGYQASNTVSLKVRDLARLGEVMDGLAGQGANQIHGPGFQIDDPEPVYDEARVAAIAKAQARAETYAKALGMRVRRIVSISEGGGFIQPMPVMAMAKMDMAETTPVAPGENTLSVELQVVFELGR
ncbi:SIMPL domain-containing protein [Pseudofulvimonas gallinarii]|uniref:Secreted protein n=1 Tax=Pseudofulvimonas gallinarii TaxID=634155 RepID=A0A4S3KUW7_9GAMM|nr:SIMPL domain-containing protein [Pseudofulvimonas gallinarii]TCT00874.1 hypothetical protein EDC25_102243 [Pseudofulvimonas gallinarii]THD12920.1 hypothetical protein B1808_11415 [Pseudofulvimonas gallinarii]